jgi:hypothetical protein
MDTFEGLTCWSVMQARCLVDNPKPFAMAARILTRINYFIAALAAFTCALSLFRNDLYQDGPWVKAQWLGQDGVTLLLVVPLLLWSTRMAWQRAHLKWQLINAGLLFYFVYTYAFFMFAAQLSVFYLFHLPIFGLAVIGLFLGLSHIFADPRPVAASSNTVRLVIIVYLTLMSMMFIFLWGNDIFAHLTIPEHQSDTPDGEAPLIIYSLDLTLVIPLMLLACVGYWKRRAWGLKLTAVMLAKTSTLGFALMGMSLGMWWRDQHPDLFLVGLWCTIGIVGVGLLWWYLRDLRATDLAGTS